MNPQINLRTQLRGEPRFSCESFEVNLQPSRDTTIPYPSSRISVLHERHIQNSVVYSRRLPKTKDSPDR